MASVVRWWTLAPASPPPSLLISGRPVPQVSTWTPPRRLMEEGIVPALEFLTFGDRVSFLSHLRRHLGMLEPMLNMSVRKLVETFEVDTTKGPSLGLIDQLRGALYLHFTDVWMEQLNRNRPTTEMSQLSQIGFHEFMNELPLAAHTLLSTSTTSAPPNAWVAVLLQILVPRFFLSTRTPWTHLAPDLWRQVTFASTTLKTVPMGMESMEHLRSIPLRAPWVFYASSVSVEKVNPFDSWSHDERAYTVHKFVGGKPPHTPQGGGSFHPNVDVQASLVSGAYTTLPDEEKKIPHSSSSMLEEVDISRPPSTETWVEEESPPTSFAEDFCYVYTVDFLSNFLFFTEWIFHMECQVTAGLPPPIHMHTSFADAVHDGKCLFGIKEAFTPDFAKADPPSGGTHASTFLVVTRYFLPTTLYHRHSQNPTFFSLIDFIPFRMGMVVWTERPVAEL